MEKLSQGHVKQQKAGGAAALYLALCYLAAMPYFLVVVDYLGATTAAEKVALIVGNYASMYAMYLATYIVFGIVLGVLALVLYDRLQGDAPFVARIAAAVGLLWSLALVTSGMIYTYGMTTVVALAKTDPAQAAVAWQSIETVAMGLGGAGGEILGGLWVLLVSWLAVRSGSFPKVVGWFGVIVGALGIASVVPPLHDAAFAFGLLQIVWFVSVGIVMMRTRTGGHVASEIGMRRAVAPSV